MCRVVSVVQRNCGRGEKEVIFCRTVGSKILLSEKIVFQIVAVVVLIKWTIFSPTVFPHERVLISRELWSPNPQFFPTTLHGNIFVFPPSFWFL